MEKCLEINNLNNGNKFSFLLKRLFIPIKQLFKLYPWSKLIVTIPFAYIYRFFYLLINKKNKLKEVVKYKKDENYYLLESLGLNNKN